MEISGLQESGNGKVENDEDPSGEEDATRNRAAPASSARCVRITLDSLVVAMAFSRLTCLGRRDISGWRGPFRLTLDSSGPPTDPN